jgi:hypothetical protein
VRQCPEQAPGARFRLVQSHAMTRAVVSWWQWLVERSRVTVPNQTSHWLGGILLMAGAIDLCSDLCSKSRKQNQAWRQRCRSYWHGTHNRAWSRDQNPRRPGKRSEKHGVQGVPAGSRYLMPWNDRVVPWTLGGHGRDKSDWHWSCCDWSSLGHWPCLPCRSKRKDQHLRSLLWVSRQ